MSAREKLIEIIADFAESLCWERCPNVSSCSCKEEAAREANQLIDAYAHELAEEIREGVDAGEFGVNEHDGAWDAADFIDPEVKR